MRIKAFIATSATLASSLALGASTSPTASAAVSSSTPVFAYAQFPRANFQPDVTSAGFLHLVTATGDAVVPVAVPATAEVAMNASGQIAFTARQSAGTLQVYTVNSDGTSLQAVTPPGYRSPVWSPDGSKLAVDLVGTSADPTGGVAVVDLRDHDKLTALPIDQAANVYQQVDGPASWSPDGSKLAFTTFQPQEGSGGAAFVHVANADGSSVSTLTTYGFGVSVGRIAWSPDGQSIAFSGGRFDGGGGETFGVYLAQLNGSVSRLVFGEEYADAAIDAFSPDGTKLLVHEGGTGAALVSLSTVGEASQIFPVSGIAAAAWAPDGQHVVYCRKTTTQTGGALAFPTDLYLLNTFYPQTTTQLTTSQQACDPAVEPRVVRYAGATRVETSISLSRQRASASAVVVARSDLYPDALAAAPLAAKVGASLLLSPPSGLTPGLKAEVKRLGATTAYVIGDTTALSSQVDADLQSSGVTTITRIGGATRYDTAASIAQRVGGTHAFIARGDDWPDAASVSQLAATLTQPILLTPKDSLNPSVADALAALHIGSATIIGGPAAVAPAVETAVNRAGVTTNRLAGSDRFATSVAVVEQLPNQATDPGVTLVSGRNWPDAIAAGASTTHPMVLVDPVTVANSPASKTWLESRSTSLVIAVGGADVVSPNVVANSLTNP